MNHRNDDYYYSRHERDSDRDRDREGRENEWRRDEGSRASFHPGGYGFDDPSSGRSESESPSSPYGQREPYAASGRDDWRPDDSRRDEWRRSDWSGEGRGGNRQSRYSESQFGQPRHDEGRRYGQGEYDSRRGWAGRSTTYRGSQNRDDWSRNQPARDRGRSDEGQYGNRGAGYGRGLDYDYGVARYGSVRDDDQGNARRYGVGYSGGSNIDRDRPFGDDRFYRTDEPRYYGTGYYAEGTSAFGGGFGEERWRGQSSSSGSMRDSEQGSRFYGGGYDQPRGEERPGLLRRLFGKGPKGYQRSDERLREDISERLMQAYHIDSSEVTVTVASGKVTLEGTVPDRSMKHAIEDLVDACPGVQDIDNRLRVDRNAGGYGGTSGYTAVSSASSTTPGSTSSTGTSYGGGSGAGMSSTTNYGAGGSPGTTSGSSGSSTSGTTSSGTNRSTRKDS
jgi:hypothetical protein